MEVICIDTDLLIDFRRSTRRTRGTNRLTSFIGKYSFAVSVITVYEIFKGDNEAEDEWWKRFFANVLILDFNYFTSIEAGRIYRELKLNGILIPTDDLLIAATARNNSLKLATNNATHFSRIDGLKLI